MESMSTQTIRTQPRRARRATPAPESTPTRMPLSVALWPFRWVILAALLVLALGLGLLLARELRAALDPVEQQRRALELAQERTQAQVLAPYHTTAGAIMALLLPAALGVLLLLVLAGGLVAMAVAWRRWGARPVVVLDSTGLELPELGQPPAPLVLDQRTRRTTQRPALASSTPSNQTPAPTLALVEPPQPTAPALDHPPLILAPKLERQPKSTPAPARERPVAQSTSLIIPGPPPPLAVPSFGNLLEAGLIGPQMDTTRALVLGYSHQAALASAASSLYDRWAAGLVRGGWRNLYSCGCGGLQGSGKTLTMAELLAQAAMNGARLVLVDPHAGDDQSLVTRAATLLAPALLCAPASSPAEIRAALLMVQDELQHRIDNPESERWPLILAIDEGLKLVRGEVGTLLLGLLDTLTTEGRKYEVHALFASQRWAKEDSGPFRNTLTAFYMHRMRNDEARMLTGLRAGSLPDLATLAPGEVVLYDALGNLQRLTIPYATGPALDRAATLIAAQHPAPAARQLDQAAIPVVLDLRPAAPASELGTPAPVVIDQPAAPVLDQNQPPATEAQQAPGLALDLVEATMAPGLVLELGGKRAGSLMEATPVQASSASQSPAPLGAEEARIVALFRAGKSVSEIVGDVWNINAGRGGRVYQERATQVQAAIRTALTAK